MQNFNLTVEQSEAEHFLDCILLWFYSELLHAETVGNYRKILHYAHHKYSDKKDYMGTQRKFLHYLLREIVNDEFQMSP